MASKTKKEFRIYFDNLLLKLNLKIIDNYKNSKYKHKWKCLKCDYEFIQTFDVIKRGFNCPQCYPRNGKTRNEFIIFLKNKLKEFNLELIDNYKNSTYKHKWKCLKCDYEFIQTWSHIQQGYKCSKCYPRYIGYDKKNRDKILNDEMNKNDIILIDDVYINSKYKHRWKCLKCNNIIINDWNKIQQGHGCVFCLDNYSKKEKEIVNFIKNNNIDIIENDRTILDGKELDILIPSKKIAIEFNGLYWHCEKFINDKKYHLNKTNMCLEKGIYLIHIFEDEWILKNDIVKSKIKKILHLDNSQRIHARKCEIKEINTKIKNNFLDKFHLQGKDKSNIKLGAFYNDELVSVMTFSNSNLSRGFIKSHGLWELSRFCSNYNYHIPGIASKLLSYFKINYDWKEIFSYADRRWSQGNLYNKIGFKLIKITQPNFWYIKNGNYRIHRFNLRKRKDESKDISEWILRQKEGYYRIWDCGHYKFSIASN